MVLVTLVLLIYVSPDRSILQVLPNVFHPSHFPDKEVEFVVHWTCSVVVESP